MREKAVRVNLTWSDCKHIFLALNLNPNLGFIWNVAQRVTADVQTHLFKMV